MEAERVVELKIGCHPEAAVSGGLLLQSESAVFLLFNAMSADKNADGFYEELGLGVIEFKGCRCTQCGDPNDEALPEHPLYDKGLEDFGYGIFEVINSTRRFVKECMQDVEAVLHTATLHKPHLVTHNPQEFVDTNITGTLNLLEEAASAGVASFVFTSSTSAFGRALTPPAGAPAAWVTEDVRPVPRNIYGVTKVAAEDLCELFYRTRQLPCVVLRTSRFFPEQDDDPATRRDYDDQNVKMNEFLYRRTDLEDVVNAHLLARKKSLELGFGRYIISATTPFHVDDLFDLSVNAPEVLWRRVPDYEQEYRRRGWRMFPRVDRVYVNERAQRELGWRPQYDFQHALNLLKSGADIRSPLARVVGSKGYHAERFTDGPYPVA